MLRSRFTSSLQFCNAIFLSGLLACAQAAELGEPLVRSHIGQPLVADIELSALADEAAPVQVKLANPDVYRGAGIGMHPVLSSLNMTVMRRDGRQFLHITSIKPLDAEYVHIFLELADGGRRNVRGTTLWMTPDPNPAPVAATPAPAPVPAPSSQALEAATARAAMQAPPLLRTAPAARAACPQPFSAEQVRTCAALDYKNAALTAQIVELEEKVRLLQLAVDGKVEHPAPAAPKKALPTPVAAPKPAPPPVRKTPWLLIGLGVAALLAMAGGAGFVILRRKRAGKAKAKVADAVAPDEPPRPSFIASVKNRLMPGKKVEAPAAVEPSVG